MPRCTYLSPSGQQKFVWLDDRTAHMVAVLFNATCELDPARARTAELAGGLPWGSPSGVLAAHALALSGVHVGTQLISSGAYAPAAAIDVGLICKLAAEIKPLAAALDEAELGAFDTVSLAYDLPAPAGRCLSAHAAVSVVLADVRARAEPILTDLELLSVAETPDTLAERARAKGKRLVDMLHERLGPQFYKSLVRRWSEWSNIERDLVAEIAGAGRSGFVRAEGGGKLDQARFDAAVERVLQIQHYAERQYLFSRWRSIASLVLAIHLHSTGCLPPLRDRCMELEALGKLTADTLQHAGDVQSPGLLNLMQVLRELHGLANHDARLFARGKLPELDENFTSQVRALVGDELPRALRAACGEVDRLSLLPAPKPFPAVAQVGAAEVNVEPTAEVHQPETQIPPSPEPNSRVNTTSMPDPPVQWVPSSSCIDDDRTDATAVRRFCKAHGVRTHRPTQRRLMVDWNGYQAAARAITKSAEKELDSIAKRREAEHQRKSRRAGDNS